MSQVQPYLERVIAWASSPERQPELLEARTAYFALTGEAHEDDLSYEQRMAGFLDHFVFDHRLHREGKPPVEAFADAHEAQLDALELRIFRELTGDVHGVFEVRKLGTRIGMRLREVLSGEEHEVAQKEPLPGIEKGDIFEARLVPYAGELQFTSAFLWHPREARKIILKEARRRRKSGAGTGPVEFAHELARLSLKRERYRTAHVEQIYKFR
jgi:hypothetical protein